MCIHVIYYVYVFLYSCLCVYESVCMLECTMREIYVCMCVLCIYVLVCIYMVVLCMSVCVCSDCSCLCICVLMFGGRICMYYSKHWEVRGQPWVSVLNFYLETRSLLFIAAYTKLASL